MALRVVFASLGAGLHSSDTTRTLIVNMRAAGVPEDILKDCAEHMMMNRSSFMQGFMG